jgi:hypothetical protein
VEDPLPGAQVSLRQRIHSYLFGGAVRFSSAIRSRRNVMARTRAYTASPASTIVKTAYRTPRMPKAGLRFIATPNRL